MSKTICFGGILFILWYIAAAGLAVVVVKAINVMLQILNNTAEHQEQLASVTTLSVSM